MADIYHDFPIVGSSEEVFEAISSPTGLKAWWPKQAAGDAKSGAMYDLGFGPGYDWKALVRVSIPREAFELEMQASDEDWAGTRVGFRLEEKEDHTQVQFYHTGWPEQNAHYRQSTYCWATYLRHLKRYVEEGIVVPYEERPQG